MDNAQSVMDNKSPNPVVVASLVVGLLLVFMLTLFALNSDDIRTADVGGEDGILGGQFTLTSDKGPVSLSDYRNKVVMVYFGFLNCEHVCPTSMSTMTTALNRLEPQEREQVQVIFVSVDPQEDTPEELAAYTAQYHSQIIGVTGSDSEISAVINEYGAYAQLTEIGQNDFTRAFRHSSRYYMVDQSGLLVDAMRHGSTPNELVARIRTLI